MEGFDKIIAGWQLCVTLQTRTPLIWLRRHNEFHEGEQRPAEEVPPEHAIWVSVTRPWRELGIGLDDLPKGTMASQIGQVPADGGDFLPFLIEYRMIVEGTAASLSDLGVRYPQYREVLRAPTPHQRKKTSSK
jgi:hypothetical protein